MMKVMKKKPEVCDGVVVVALMMCPVNEEHTCGCVQGGCEGAGGGVGSEE